MPDATADPRPPGPRDYKCDYDLPGTAVHIRPRNDLMWHTLDTACPCGPTTRNPGLADTDIDAIVVHHALDGRQPQGGHYIPAPLPTDNYDDDSDDGYAGACA